MEIGTVRQVDISKEVQEAYLDYAMSVIVARALPDVRDGLKPVHRRILYAMHDMGIAPDKAYRKSARIVGEVLGKYHPHGDAAVYESMVRMAQDFSMRYLLVDGQGNFGSVDGDEAAAMRYTEARLHSLAVTMLEDIEKQTVAFGPNFDGTLEEPLVLPSALPNFLVNGASGIAVGMATNVPPHNLSEVCDALCYMIGRYDRLDEITVEDLMQFIAGPDFPTGGIVYRYENDGPEGPIDVIKAAYAVGRGRFMVQARAHIEEMSRNRSRIVVTELPYQINKTRLIERIAELAREGRLDGVADLRDESDRQGMRLVIELTRTVEPKEVLAKLFKLTPMRSTFGVNILALVDGEPRTLPLKRALWHYLEHRREIVTRRTEFELEQARRQAHILEGLLIALDNLDAVIATIRQSQNAETARTNLIRKFKLSELQAQAILEMPLRRLAALEQKKIREDYKERLARIAYLEELLSDPHRILGVVADELRQLKQRYGDARRTQLVERTSDIMLAGDLVEEEAMLVLATDEKIWREPLGERRRGELTDLPGGPLAAVAAGQSTGDLALFTADGRGVLVPLHQVPRGADSACSLGELLNTSVSAGMVAAFIVPAETRREETPPGFLLLTSAQGKVKRTTLAEFYAVAGRGLTTVMGVEAPDRLTAAFLTEGDEEIVLLSAGGQAIRFEQEEVRPMGLPAGGVAGIKLADDDELVGAGLGRKKADVVVITGQGYAKRSSLEDYPKQKRYGTGVVGVRVAGRAGRVVGGAVVVKGDELYVVTAGGRAFNLPPAQIAAAARSAAGKSALKLSAGDRIARLVVAYGVAAAAPAASAPASPQRAAAAPAAAAGAQQLALDLENGASSRRPAAAAPVETPAKASPKPPSLEQATRVVAAPVPEKKSGGAKGAVASESKPAGKGALKPKAAPAQEPAPPKRKSVSAVDLAAETPAGRAIGKGLAAPAAGAKPAPPAKASKAMPAPLPAKSGPTVKTEPLADKARPAKSGLPPAAAKGAKSQKTAPTAKAAAPEPAAVKTPKSEKAPAAAGARKPVPADQPQPATPKGGKSQKAAPPAKTAAPRPAAPQAPKAENEPAVAGAKKPAPAVAPKPTATPSAGAGAKPTQPAPPAPAPPTPANKPAAGPTRSRIVTSVPKKPAPKK